MTDKNKMTKEIAHEIVMDTARKCAAIINQETKGYGRASTLLQLRITNLLCLSTFTPFIRVQQDIMTDHEKAITKEMREELNKELEKEKNEKESDSQE